jgi:aryl-alcohol dehydrogenase-like predicted oxidoreductase
MSGEEIPMQLTENRSQFGLGCVNLGSKGLAGVRLVHHALDLGVHFFDTADAYGSGQSERILGRALRYRRDKAFIATKGGYLFHDRSALAAAARGFASRGVQIADRRLPLARGRSSRPGTAYGAQDFSPSYLRSAVEGSLARLGTDFLDLYQLHGPRSVHEDVVALMLDLQSEGKIRGFGVGVEGLDTAYPWLATGSLSSIQIPFGILDPDAGREIIPRAGALGVGVVVRGVFAGGFVAQPPPSDMALLRPGQTERLAALRRLASEHDVNAMQLAAWFATARPGITTVLIGTASGRHLSDSVRYVRTPPPVDVLRQLDALADDTTLAPVRPK